MDRRLVHDRPPGRRLGAHLQDALPEVRRRDVPALVQGPRQPCAARRSCGVATTTGSTCRTSSGRSGWPPATASRAVTSTTAGCPSRRLRDRTTTGRSCPTPKACRTPILLDLKARSKESGLRSGKALGPQGRLFFRSKASSTRASGKMMRSAVIWTVKDYGGIKRPARVVMKNMLNTKRIQHDDVRIDRHGRVQPSPATIYPGRSRSLNHPESPFCHAPDLRHRGCTAAGSESPRRVPTMQRRRRHRRRQV